MRLSSVILRIENEGICSASKHYIKKLVELKDKIIEDKNAPEPEPEPQKVYNILLLTNRDSDNVGDQVIEACDISLISTVMDNLGIEKKNFKINSRAAAIISQKYLATRDESLLETAHKLIEESDIIIFGGAPVFNYRYQNFYERTAVTLEIAQKYNKPVIFSAIGVDGYDSQNRKCQRLKETLNFDCVKQITTRDDFDSLQKFVENKNILIGKVSDPAVFASKVFEDFVQWNSAGDKKKIGIFILRSNGFTDNGYNFSRDTAASFWKELVCELKDKGYDYEVLTSGHFGDEAFLDYLIKNYGMDAEKCVFNINYPEKLVRKISTYDAVISCRLHPSIISYSLDVPSFGIVWNSKVNYFYESIGHGDRVINVKGINPNDVLERVGRAISEGVNKEQEYLVSNYNSLFLGIKNILCPEKDEVVPYHYDELLEKIVTFKGTSEREKEEKLKRKFRRTYGKYNEIFDKNLQNKKIANELQAEYKGFRIIYNGGVQLTNLSWTYDETLGKIQKLETGSVEYCLNQMGVNDGNVRLLKNEFVYPGHTFIGWRMRIKEDEKWYWYLEDKTYKLQMDYDKGKDKDFYLLKDEEVIPLFHVKNVVTIVLEAVWQVDGMNSDIK